MVWQVEAGKQTTSRTTDYSKPLSSPLKNRKEGKGKKKIIQKAKKEETEREKVR